MRTYRREALDRIVTPTVLVFALLALGGAPTRTSQPVPPSVLEEPGPPAWEPLVLDPGEARVLADVYGLFADAGLSVPQVPVSFHIDALHCGGYRGMQRTLENGAITIDVCLGHDIEEIEQTGRHRILVHEMAHAYLERTLSERQRTDFLELRGLREWGTGPWESRGAEHAAELLVWELTNYDVHVWLGGDSCTELGKGVEVLVGRTLRVC